MQTDAEVAAIAAAMNHRIRKAFRLLSRDWQPRPDFPRTVITFLGYFREQGLVERQFGDECQPEYRASPDGLSVKVRACWYFRLSKRGLRVAQHLKQENAK